MSSSSERGKLRPPGEPSRARAGWRKPASSGSSGSSRYWTQRQDRGLEQTTVNRIKLTAYAVALFVLVVVFVAYLLFRPRPVPLAALTVTDYRSPVHPNALAAEDLRRFEAAFKGYRNIRFSGAMEGRDGHWKALLRGQLQRVRAGGPGKGRLFPDNDVVLLYLSAHGVVDSQARPCLLMSGSDPLDERTWIPVLDVVTYVNEFVGSSRKVLILDGGRIRENWPVGILHNGFADALQHTLQEKPVDRLFVLNSTRRDQRAHAAPELGGSVFAWFVAAGLRGAADTNQDKRVNLQELYDYLQNHVDSWVRQNRSERQRPLLVPEDADDFGLTYVTDYQRPDAEPIPSNREREGTIDRLWARYARLEQAGLYRTAPLDCALLSRDLARLETLNFAGDAYAEQFNATAAAIELALTGAETDAVAQRLVLTSGSTVLRQRLGQLSEADIQAAGEAYKKWRQKPEGPPPEPVKVAYPAACAAVWRDLIDQASGNPRPQIEDALRFLQTTPDHRCAARQRNRAAWSVTGVSRLGSGRIVRAASNPGTRHCRAGGLARGRASPLLDPGTGRCSGGGAAPRTRRVVCGRQPRTGLGRAALDRTDRRRHGGPVRRDCASVNLFRKRTRPEIRPGTLASSGTVAVDISRADGPPATGAEPAGPGTQESRVERRAGSACHGRRFGGDGISRSIAQRRAQRT